MIGSRPPTRLAVIADLHISAGPGDDFREDEALAGFLEQLAERAANDESRWALLILGDLLQFPELPVGAGWRLDSSAGAALAKLELAASHHRRVFRALGRAAAAGVELELVAGNHDAELVRPPVRERLRQLLCEAAGAAPERIRLHVHPWVFHLPGLLYAEHGHRHHDINRMPELLDPARIERGGPLPAPLGTHLAFLLSELEELLGERFGGIEDAPRALARALREHPLRLAAATAPLLPRAIAAGARIFGRPPRPDPGRVAPLLPAAAVAELAEMSAATPREVLARILRGGGNGGDDYMVAAATGVHRILASRDAATAFYVFGHTHVAADRALAPGPAAPRYLNPGTWSRLRPKSAAPSFLELELDRGHPQASLLQWSASATGALPLAPTIATGAV